MAAFRKGGTALVSQETGWPLVDFYSAWLRWVQSMMRLPGSSGGFSTGSVSLAPETLTQPINPGWVFGSVNITNRNSGDPEVERRILEAVSYGRQLGRVMDAVAVLVARADPKGLTSEQKKMSPNQKEAFDDFWDIMVKIKDAKSEAASRWLSEQHVNELVVALRTLKQNDPAKHERFVAILRSALET